ncbi:hypothetical protein LR48_Vigan04g177900 [Vigna angularis]|uniref:Putative plant transposon protein domain-containing protein n=1 Tax=Phaseolus angularis TaxID=3914 RepID=A0A0L9UFV3_PHAAN|nr:hypothetical protein LR48_Vigan04g177900 [Vigna angularis]
MKTTKVVIHVEEGTVKLKDQDEEVTFNVFGVEQQNHEKETSLEATDELLSITSLTEQAAKLVKRSLSCLSPRVKGEEEEKEEELVHQNPVMASDEPKPGKPTTAGLRENRRKEKIYSDIFLTKDHKKHFSNVQNRKLLMERKVTLLPQDVPDFSNEIMERQWSHLTTYPEPANIAIVQEFYANAKSFSPDTEPFWSYVRGQRIPFNADTINEFLNTEWEDDDELCGYAELCYN